MKCLIIEQNNGKTKLRFSFFVRNDICKQIFKMKWSYEEQYNKKEIWSEIIKERNIEYIRFSKFFSII